MGGWVDGLTDGRMGGCVVSPDPVITARKPKLMLGNFRNAGKDMVTSPKAGYKDGNNGVAVTYRFHEWGIGSFDIPGGKFYELPHGAEGGGGEH